MQPTVRNAGTVIDWMQGTLALLQADDPQLKATALQAFGIKTDADWQTKRTDLIQQLQAAIGDAQGHVISSTEAFRPAEKMPYVPADAFGAVFQSAMDEHLTDRMATSSQAVAAGAEAPYGQPEKFDSGDVGWVVVLFARLAQAIDGKHVFIHATDLSVFRYDLSDTTSVALFADWATGEGPAQAVATAIKDRAPEYLIHLGDTYYAGFEDEVRHNLIACWPGDLTIGKSFALNGNHEMYSGGNAYFNLLPLFGHPASYFNVGNSHWRIIALDTAWPERTGADGGGLLSSWGELVAIEVEWLKAQIAHAKSFNPPAIIILLTHHQLYSAFDAQGDVLGQYLRRDLQPFLVAGDIYAWFWGHEHRGIAYQQTEANGFFARCIGHGGIPYPSPSVGEKGPHADKFPILWAEERPEPGNEWYGMRGFALLTLNGPQLRVDYIDQTNEVYQSEQWA